MGCGQHGKSYCLLQQTTASQPAAWGATSRARSGRRGDAHHIRVSSNHAAPQPVAPALPFGPVSSGTRSRTHRSSASGSIEAPPRTASPTGKRSPSTANDQRRRRQIAPPCTSAARSAPARSTPCCCSSARMSAANTGSLSARLPGCGAPSRPASGPSEIKRASLPAAGRVGGGEVFPQPGCSSTARFGSTAAGGLQSSSIASGRIQTGVSRVFWTTTCNGQTASIQDGRGCRNLRGRGGRRARAGACHTRSSRWGIPPRTRSLQSS